MRFGSNEVTADHIAAHKVYLRRKIAEMLRKKPDHTHYDQLNILGQALAAIEKMEVVDMAEPAE